MKVVFVSLAIFTGLNLCLFAAQAPRPTDREIVSVWDVDYKRDGIPMLTLSTSSQGEQRVEIPESMPGKTLVCLSRTTRVESLRRLCFSVDDLRTKLLGTP